MRFRYLRAVFPPILVMGMALAFRLYLNNSGIPGLAHLRNDEIHYIVQCLAFLNNDWRVEYFVNPTLFSYLLFGATAVWGWHSVLFGLAGSFQDFVDEVSRNPHDVILAGRMLSILFSTGSVGLVYMATRRLFSPLAAVAAAAALAFNFTHAQRAPLAGNESVMVFVILLFFLALLRWSESPSAKRHALCGLLLGLAGSCKYNALIHAIPFLLFSYFTARKMRFRSPWRRDSTLGYLFVPMGLLLGSPWIALNFDVFLHEFGEQAGFLHCGYTELDRTAKMLGYAAYIVNFPKENNGIAFALVCAAGIGFSIALLIMRRSSREHGLLLSAAIPLYLFLGSGIFHYMRFLLPAIPFVLILGAWALDRSWKAAIGRIGWDYSGRSILKKLAGWTGFGLLLAALLLQGALKSHARMQQLYGGRSPLTDMVLWMNAHLSGQEKVLTFPLGIPGFEKYTTYLVYHKEENDLNVYWMESTVEPTVTFTIVDPGQYGLSYDFELTEEELELLQAKGPEDLGVFMMLSKKTMRANPSAG